jgi:PAS domain S-box-containing protein
MDADRRRLLLFRKLYPFLQWLPGFILLQTLDRRVRYANRYLRERFGDPGDRPLHEILFGERGLRPDWDPDGEPGAGAPWEWEGPLADGRVYKVCALPFTEEDGSSLLLLLGVAGPGSAEREPGRGDDDTGRRTVGAVAEFARAALPKLRAELAERDRQIIAARAGRDAAERERRALEERTRALEDEVEGLRLSLRMGRSLLLGTQRNLAESRERFRAVGECVPHGVWSCSPDGDIRFMSPAFLDLLGMTEAECRRSGWEGRLHPDDASRTRAAWRHAVASGDPLDLSCRVLDAGGRIRRLLLRGRPVRDASGAVTGWAGVALDGDGQAGKAEGPVRERGRSRAVAPPGLPALPVGGAPLREARRQRMHPGGAADRELSFREFMESSTLTGFVAADRDSRIVFVNDAFCAMTGWSKEELLGTGPPYGFWCQGEPGGAPEGNGTCRDLLFGAGVPSPSGGLVFRFAKPDGSPVDILGHSLPLRDDKGAVRGHLGSVHDITDRLRAEQALRDSEERYRKMVEMARDVIFVVDGRGITTSLNPAFEQLLGWSREEWIGKPLPAILHPEDVANGVDRLRRSFAGETLPMTIYRARMKSGGYRTFESLGFPLIEKGKPVAVVGVSRDVTERVEAEKALRELSQALQEIVHASPLAIVVLDPEGRVELWNPAAEQIFGWTDEGVSGHPIPAVAAEDREPFREYLVRAVAGERLANLEVRGVRKDGAAMEALVSLAPLRDGEGIIRSALVVLADITERRRAEDALRDTTETLRKLLHASPVGIAALDPEGRIRMWNPAMEKIFGWTEDEVLGRPLPAGPEEKQEEIRALEDRLVRGENLVGLELTRRRKDGSLVDVLLSAAPVRDAVETVRSVISVFLDVTETKALERMALIQEKMASLGHVATGIAHEIRNPLSGLNIYLSALGKALGESETLEPEVRETADAVVNMAVSASSRIEGVIRRVMEFASPAPLRLVPVCLNHCVKEVLHLAAVTLRKAGIHLDEALAEDLPSCRGDARLLGQVVLNLLTNAAQAMEGKEGEKRIAVASFRKGKYAVVAVADSGPGVPEDLREKIFDPFFTTKKEGTGIGLSLSHRIVAEHGGFLEVDSSALGGAAFRLGIPVATQEPVRPT